MNALIESIVIFKAVPSAKKFGIARSLLVVLVGAFGILQWLSSSHDGGQIAAATVSLGLEYCFALWLGFRHGRGGHRMMLNASGFQARQIKMASWYIGFFFAPYVVAAIAAMILGAFNTDAQTNAVSATEQSVLGLIPLGALLALALLMGLRKGWQTTVPPEGMADVASFPGAQVPIAYTAPAAPVAYAAPVVQAPAQAAPVTTVVPPPAPAMVAPVYRLKQTTFQKYWQWFFGALAVILSILAISNYVGSHKSATTASAPADTQDDAFVTAMASGNMPPEPTQQETPHPIHEEAKEPTSAQLAQLRRRTPPASASLGQLFNVSVIGTTVAHFEKIAGPALRVASNSYGESRTYQVKGCPMVVEDNNGTISTLMLALSPECTVPDASLPSYLQGLDLSHLTFQALFPRMAQSASDTELACAAYAECGNSQDPSLTATLYGSQTDGFINAAFSGSITSDNDVAVLTKAMPEEAKRLGVDDMDLTSKAYNQDPKFLRSIVPQLGDVLVTSLTLTNVQPPSGN